MFSAYVRFSLFGLLLHIIKVVKVVKVMRVYFNSLLFDGSCCKVFICHNVG